MSSLSKIPVALIGGGDVAPRHATYLLSSNTCTPVAIIDPFSPGRELGKKLSIPHFDSIELLLSSRATRPEAYIICAPSSLHASITTNLLEVAMPKLVLIEKPVVTDARSGAALVNLAKKHGTTILVGHQRRFHSSLVAAKHTIASGLLGDITAISGLWTALKNDGYYTAAKWRSSRSGGGGPIWTNIIHDVDALHFILGSRITRVWVVKTKNQRQHQDIPSEDLVEEGGAIMLQFANGIVGTFVLCDSVTSPYSWELGSGDNVALPKASVPVDAYRIFGTRGSLSIPDGLLWSYTEEAVTKSGRERGWNVPISVEALDIKPNIPFQEQIEHLSRVIEGKEEPRCSVDEGLAAVRVCEALMRALEHGDGLPIDIDQGTTLTFKDR